MTSWQKLFLVAVVALVAAACSARRGEPIRGRFFPSSSKVALGRLVFMAHCHKCHPGGEAGLGPSLNDKPLPEPLIAMQIRTGLGAMPSFPNSQIDERELDALIRYMKAIRRH